MTMTTDWHIIHCTALPQIWPSVTTKASNEPVLPHAAKARHCLSKGTLYINKNEHCWGGFYRQVKGAVVAHIRNIMLLGYTTILLYLTIVGQILYTMQHSKAWVLVTAFGGGVLQLCGLDVHRPKSGFRMRQISLLHCSIV